ncbi:MAG TPA: CDP-glycerol glycerophosphotransferase family protein [Sphingomicrobium sp.]|nr:CDP-glycerol glycerophosphotransferase family protein [Sphingomicrobium sp.]
MDTALAKASRIAANLVVRPLSGYSKRRRNLWLFGHQGGAFAGNSKFLYLWLARHRSDIEAVWITHRKDVAAHLEAHHLPVRLRGTPGALDAALKAAVYLYCHGPEDVSVALGGGAFLVNLWHGIGLKATHFGDPRSNASIYSDPNISWARRTLGLGSRLDPDLLIATSEFTSAHFADQFRLPLERCPPCGYPRLDPGLDPLLSSLVEELDGDKVAVLRSGSPDEVYVYAPTYRDSARDFLVEAIPDRGRLSAILEQRNAILYLKLHPHTSVHGDWSDRRIRLWPKDVDLYSAFSVIDGLITDYSSLHYDWIHHSDRGAVLYTFDRQEYERQDRSLLYPFDENVAGWRAASFDELLELMGSGKALEKHPDVRGVRKKFWGEWIGPASPRIVAAIEERLSR